MENISLVVAFSGGLLSFLSPCVLPLVPVYLASLTGTQVLDSGEKPRLSLFFHSLSFVLGFSLIFVLLGAIAGVTGFAFNPSTRVLSKVSGGLLIAFGAFMLASLKVSWLNYEKRLHASSGKAGYMRSFLIGAVFSMAWTACVGPILGGILSLALNTATAWRGAFLLAIYSLGLGVPFLLIGAAFDVFLPVLRKVQRYSGYITIAGAILLIVAGILTLTNSLNWFSRLSF